MSFDVQAVRAQFPVLDQEVNGKPLVYLDNAATSQKPQVVIDAISNYYEQYNSNIHRGVHHLSELATAAYEGARETTQAFLNAKSTKEIIFTRGTTEGINLVAQAWARPNLQAGDEIVITHLEHHSNIVPWQMLCKQTGAVLKVAPINERGEVIMDEFKALMTDKTKMVSVSHISNALGTINPIAEMIELAHAVGAKVLVDGAQATPHAVVDVQQLDVDFYAFSGHKVYGPTGIGALYGKEELLEAMEPYQGGGEMIKVVSFEGTTYNDLPHKFEAGTPNIAGAIGMGAALKFMMDIGVEAIAAWEDELLTYAMQQVADIEGLTVIGTAENKASILSFVMDGLHPQDVGTIIDQQGVAIRAGHHCAMPALEFFGLKGTSRASFACYNTKEDIDRFVAGLQKTIKFFALDI